MINLTQKTYSDINLALADRIKKLRKRKGLSQEELSAKSGVSYGSIKRFEQTGDISLQSLTKIAIALNADNEIDNLFTEIPFSSIEELMRETNR